MYIDILGPVVTFLGALLAIAGGFWNVEHKRPTKAGIAAGAVAAIGMLISIVAARETSIKAEDARLVIDGLRAELDRANGQISSARAEVDKANQQLSSVKSQLDEANAKLGRMNVDLQNDYAQGGWTGSAASGSILKTYGFSCDATVRTESGLKKAEFFIPSGEEAEVPLFGVGGEIVQIAIEFPAPQCDGKIIVTGIAP